jgi:hypothetical protein
VDHVQKAAGDAAYRLRVDGQQASEGEEIFVVKSPGAGDRHAAGGPAPVPGLILLFPFPPFPDRAQKMVPWLPARWLAR